MKKNINAENPGNKKSKNKRKLLIISTSILVIFVGIFLIVGSSNKPKDIVYIDGIPMVDDGYIENIIIADSLDRSTYEWMEYKDLDRVKKDIDSQVSKLIKALESENVNKIIKYFCEAERDNYKEIFENDTELMKSLSSFFGDMELVYLSEKTDDKETSFLRIAEYSLTYNNSLLSVIFIYEDGKWYIKDL